MNDLILVSGGNKDDNERDSRSGQLYARPPG